MRRHRSGRRSTSTRPLLRPAAVLAVGLVVLPVYSGSPRADGGDAEERQAVAVLPRQVDVLEKRVELTTGEEFYLLVDPTARTLKLMLQAAVLREYPIEGLEVGKPRIAFRDRELGEGWVGRIWSK